MTNRGQPINLLSFQQNMRMRQMKKSVYPFECFTKKNNSDYPTEQEVRRKLPQIEFLRYPLAKTVSWMFIHEPDMQLFKSQFVTLDNKEDYK